MRLAKFLAHAGVASRRASEWLIASGRVEVDGDRVTDPARDVGAANRVALDGRELELESAEHHLLNKPVGVVSTASDPQGRQKVTDLVESRARLYPVGRLDADSSGLIILTNDGELASRLMHPSYQVPKTYLASVSGHPSDDDLKMLRDGVGLDDGATAPAAVVVADRSERSTLLELTIHEGRKRQVRRMCDSIGHRVITLERRRIGTLELGDLGVGRSRRLTDDELSALRVLVAGDDA